MIELGSKVRDVVTGFSGIAVSRTEWIFGCTRYGVDTEELRDGKPVDTVWFDEQRLEVVAPRSLQASVHSTAERGGDRPDPRRPVAPPR